MSKPGYNVPKRCLVTGGSGFVGQRLVEMLIERGAEHVVSFDIAPAPKDAMISTKITYIQGDLTKYESVLQACQHIDCVFHIAALVGPYHPKEAYKKVNYEGTVNVLNACQHHNIHKLVMSSSPSTRFPSPDRDRGRFGPETKPGGSRRRSFEEAPGRDFSGRTRRKAPMACAPA